jgi:hypothetical protein
MDTLRNGKKRIASRFGCLVSLQKTRENYPVAVVSVRTRLDGSRCGDNKTSEPRRTDRILRRPLRQP